MVPDKSACCGAAISVDENAVLYCKKCYGEVFSLAAAFAEAE